MRDFIETNSRAHTLVRSPEPERLRALLETAGARVRLDATGGWRVEGPDPATIGDLARDHGVAVHELTPAHSSLEEVYTALSQSSVEYRAEERTEDGPAAPGRKETVR